MQKLPKTQGGPGRKHLHALISKGPPHHLYQIWVKVQFRGPELLKKSGHYFKKNFTYLVSLCLHKQVGDTTVNGWPLFEYNFNVFADMILPNGRHCIDMTPSPEPINGAIGTWLSCFATCDWLRALVHLHCDVMITTSMTKTWWSCRSLGVDLPCLRKKVCHQKTMWMRWKLCKCKDEDLKIFGK